MTMKAAGNGYVVSATFTGSEGAGTYHLSLDRAGVPVGTIANVASGGVGNDRFWACVIRPETSGIPSCSATISMPNMQPIHLLYLYPRRGHE